MLVDIAFNNPFDHSLKGFFQLQRRFFSHWLWTGESRSFSKAEAFLDLLQLAAFTRTKKIVGTSLLELEPGEVCGSERYLSGRWGWSTKKVRAFLTLLEADQMVGRSRNQGVTIITICNYAKYTFGGSGEEAEKNHSGSGEEAARKQIEQREEGKHKDKALPLPFDSPEFAEAWSHWITHNIQRRKKLTESTQTAQLRKLAKFGEPGAIESISRSIERNWQGLFEPEKGQDRAPPSARAKL